MVKEGVRVDEPSEDVSPKSELEPSERDETEVTSDRAVLADGASAAGLESVLEPTKRGLRRRRGTEPTEPGERRSDCVLSKLELAKESAASSECCVAVPDTTANGDVKEAGRLLGPPVAGRNEEAGVLGACEKSPVGCLPLPPACTWCRSITPCVETGRARVGRAAGVGPTGRLAGTAVAG